MSKISKYFIKNSDLCTFSFQSDVPCTEFRSSNNNVGLLYVNAYNNLQWSITVQGFDDNNNLIYQNETSNLLGGKVLFDFQFGITVSTMNAVLTIYNPEIILKLYGFYIYPYDVYIINHDGIAKMLNISTISSYGGRFRSTSSLIFDIMPQLTSFNWDADDISGFDDRIFSKDCTNLTNLTLEFPFTPNHKLENLKKAPNLLTLDVNDEVNNEHGHDIFFDFDDDFDWSFKNFHLTSRYNPLETIHTSYANLSYLENFSTGGGNCGLDLTFPLKENQDNTVLKIISIGWNCKIYNTPSTNGKEYIYPQNIERLTALESINNSRFLRTGEGDNLFDKFYTMFYSKIYNETDNTKEGFTISSNSSYFQSLTTPPHGFIHPSFRKHDMTSSHSYTIKIPLSYTNKYNEINDTGFELIAYFE